MGDIPLGLPDEGGRQPGWLLASNPRYIVVVTADDGVASTATAGSVAAGETEVTHNVTHVVAVRSAVQNRA